MTENTDPFSTLSDEEVRILEPDYALKKLIGEDVDLGQIFSAENIEKAQQIINTHADDFREWVLKDIEQLEESYAKAAANPLAAEPEIKKLSRTALIIKSQAGMFGFMLGTQIAKSLDDFCNHYFRLTVPEHMTVIAKHIETLSVIFHKNITGDGGALGKELSDGLSKLIEKYKNK